MQVLQEKNGNDMHKMRFLLGLPLAAGKRWKGYRIADCVVSVMFEAFRLLSCEALPLLDLGRMADLSQN
jgi:hypothetical protein